MLSLFLELERVSVTIPAGGLLIALLFIWYYYCLQKQQHYIWECMPLCFFILEAEDSFSIVLGNRLKIVIKRYTGAQQICLIEAFSAFEQMTQMSLVGHVTRNAWWLYCLIDNRMYPTVSPSTAEMNVEESRVWNLLQAPPELSVRVSEFFGGTSKCGEPLAWGAGNACAHQCFSDRSVFKFCLPTEVDLFSMFVSSYISGSIRTIRSSSFSTEIKEISPKSYIHKTESSSILERSIDPNSAPLKNWPTLEASLFSTSNSVWFSSVLSCFSAVMTNQWDGVGVWDRIPAAAHFV